MLFPISQDISVKIVIRMRSGRHKGRGLILGAGKLTLYTSKRPYLSRSDEVFPSEFPDRLKAHHFYSIAEQPVVKRARARS